MSTFVNLILAERVAQKRIKKRSDSIAVLFKRVHKGLYHKRRNIKGVKHDHHHHHSCQLVVLHFSARAHTRSFHATLFQIVQLKTVRKETLPRVQLSTSLMLDDTIEMRKRKIPLL